MRKLHTILTMLAAAGMVATSTPTATANPSVAAAGCGLNLGSVTAGGDQTFQRLTTTPSAGTKSVVPDLYSDGAVRMSASFVNEPTAPGSSRHGRVMLAARRTSPGSSSTFRNITRAGCWPAPPRGATPEAPTDPEPTADLRTPTSGFPRPDNRQPATRASHHPKSLFFPLLSFPCPGNPGRPPKPATTPNPSSFL